MRTRYQAFSERNIQTKMKSNVFGTSTSDNKVVLDGPINNTVMLYNKKKKFNKKDAAISRFYDQDKVEFNKKSATLTGAFMSQQSTKIKKMKQKTAKERKVLQVFGYN